MDSQNTQYTVKNLPVFLYAVNILIFQIKRIIASENGLTTTLLLFFLGWPISFFIKGKSKLMLKTTA